MDAATGLDSLLAGAAGVLAALLCAWALLCGALGLASRIPGRLGRLAGELCRRLVPAALRAVLCAALGGSATLTLGAAAHADGPAATRPAVPELDRPATGAADPTGPIANAPGARTPTSVDGPPEAPRSPSHEVVVRPGDSLWEIARRAAGPEATPAAVAASWPRWWATNRAVIGADPNRLRPGQHLIPPAPTP